jgi:hypothetical protein
MQVNDHDAAALSDHAEAGADLLPGADTHGVDSNLGHAPVGKVGDERCGFFVRLDGVEPAEIESFSRLNAIGSTATTNSAPAAEAPRTALMPMPPTPTTATVSPCLASPV